MIDALSFLLVTLESLLCHVTKVRKMLIFSFLIFFFIFFFSRVAQKE